MLRLRFCSAPATNRGRTVGPAGALLGAATAASLIGLPAYSETPAWLTSAAAQAQLVAGEVVMRSELGAASASVDAAIRVRATPKMLWSLITNCQSVSAFVPGLKHCQRLQTAADGSWSIVEHDIRYSLLMPLIRSVVRSHYQPPYRVDFTGVGGNIKAESGSWVLEPLADGRATTVEYSIAIEPGFLVPRSVVRHSLNKELPMMLARLRARAEAAGTAAEVVAPRADELTAAAVPPTDN